MRKIGLFLFLFLFLGIVSAGTVTVTLISPADTSTSSVTPTVFNCSASTDSGNIINVSWFSNSTGTWHLNETITDLGGTTNYYTLDEGSGDVIDENDVNNGTNVGATAGSTGIIGTGYDFVQAGSDHILLDNNISLTGDFTLSFWASVDDASSHIVAYKAGITSNHNRIFFNTNQIQFQTQTATGVISTTITTGSYHMYTITREGTNVSVFYDGTYQSSATIAGTLDFDSIGSKPSFVTSLDYYDGKFDEFAVYVGRRITNAEITTLYNSGSAERPSFTSSLYNIFSKTIPIGTTLWNCNACDSEDSCDDAVANFTVNSDAIPPSVVLSSPLTLEDQGSFSINQSLNFTATDAANLDTCWYEYNNTNTTISCSSGVLVSTSFQLEEGDYTITVFANDTLGNLGSDSITWSYKVLLNSVDYTAHTYETAGENFTANITANASLTNVQLVYNGTEYSTTNSGNLYYKSLQMEQVSFTSNKSFHWKFTYAGDTINSGSYQQEIQKIFFVLCNATYADVYLNLTFKDEADLSNVNATIPSSTFIYYLGDGTINKTYTFLNNTAHDNYSFCFSQPTETIFVDTSLQYASTGYPQRIYDPKLTTLSSSTTNKTLYLLGTVDGLFVTFQVINVAQQVLGEVIVNATRLISGETVLVGQGITDAAGTVTFWLNPDFVHNIGFEAEGFDVLFFSVAPTQTIYTIVLGSTNVVSSGYLRGMSFLITPQDGFLYEHTLHNFTFDLTSNHWALDSFGFNLSFSNGTVIGTVSSSSVTGGVLSINDVNVSNDTGIVMQPYFIVEGVTTLVNLPRIWRIQEIEGTEFSIWNFFTNLNTFTDDGLFGFGDFGKIILSIFVIVVMVGGLSFRYGLRSESAVTGLIFSIVFLLEIGLEFIPQITIPATGVILPRGILTVVTFLMLVGVLIAEERR